MSPTFFEWIHRLLTSTILNKMGLHCHLLQSMVFAPWELGGVGSKVSYMNKSVQQLLILVCRLHAMTPLSTALKLFIRTYQLWAGIRWHVLDNTQPYPWILDHWLSNLHALMHLNWTQLCYKSWTIPPLHIHNQYLMEDFAEHNFPWHKLEQLNACCMYLQVKTLAEVTNHTGMELFPQAFLTLAFTCPKGLDTISMSTL